jgi:glutamate carboxypeptidase
MERAGHLFGRKLTGSGKKFVLIGHLDTVFEADDDFQAFARDGNTATGPGVEDMKGGNMVIVYALKALCLMTSPSSWPTRVRKKNPVCRWQFPEGI